MKPKIQRPSPTPHKIKMSSEVPWTIWETLFLVVLPILVMAFLVVLALVNMGAIR
jgi:hypothetical protein